jgi:hypothetical protein
VRELGRWSRGTAWLTATFPLVFDLPETLASSGGGLCVGCEVERVGKREGVEWRVNVSHPKIWNVKINKNKNNVCLNWLKFHKELKLFDLS